MYYRDVALFNLRKNYLITVIEYYRSLILIHQYLDDLFYLELTGDRLRQSLFNSVEIDRFFYQFQHTI